MSETDDKRLHLGMRLLLWTVVVLAALAGFVLFVFSDRTDRLFAWTIEPPISAAFLGAAYLSASLMAYLCVRPGRWRDARPMAVGIATVTPLLLAVTLVHHAKFRLTVFAGVAWLVVYASLTVLTPILIAIQIRGRRSRPKPPIQVETALVLLLALGLCVFGGLLLLSPGSSSSVWPWHLTTLTARAIGSWFVAHGITAGWIAWRGDLLRVPGAAIGYAAFGALGILAVIRYRSALDPGSARTVLLVAALALATIGGVVVAGLARTQPDRSFERP